MMKRLDAVRWKQELWIKVPFLLLSLLIPLSLMADYRIALALIILLLSTFITLMRPLFGLGLWATLLGCQFETYSWLGVNIAPSDFFIIPLAIVAAGRLFSQRKRSEPSHTDRGRIEGEAGWAPLTKSWFWILLVFISLSSGMLFAWYNLGYLSNYILINKYIGFISLAVTFFCLVKLIDSKEEFHKLEKIFLLSGSVINGLVLVFYLLTIFGKENLLSLVVIEGMAAGRLRGFLCDANAYGGFVVPLLIFQISFLLFEDGSLPLLRKRSVAFLNTILLSLSLVLTFSRTAWLGFVVGLIYLLFSAFGSGGSKWRGIWTVLLPIAFGCAILFNLQHFGIDPGFFIFREYTYQTRRDLINMGLELYRNAPLTGIGLGIFRELAPTIIHNSFIWILVETGPLGLVALLGLFIWAIFARSRGGLQQPMVATRASILSFFIIAMGIEALYQRHLWLLFAFSEILRRLRGEI